jgi:uncharacterized membrane protein
LRNWVRPWMTSGQPRDRIRRRLRGLSRARLLRRLTVADGVGLVLPMPVRVMLNRSLYKLRHLLYLYLLIMGILDICRVFRHKNSCCLYHFCLLGPVCFEASYILHFMNFTILFYVCNHIQYPGLFECVLAFFFFLPPFISSRWIAVAIARISSIPTLGSAASFWWMISPTCL